MPEQSPETPLGRLLEEAAAITFSDDYDLWPALAARLATQPEMPELAKLPRWGSRLEERRAASSWALRNGGGQARPVGAFFGAAALLALIAIAFGAFALVRFPSTLEPTPGNLIASPMASPVTNRDCTIDQEIVAEATGGLHVGEDPIRFSIDVRTSRQCEHSSGFRMQLSDASGMPLPIEGNPVTVPFIERNDLRFINAEVIWSNWCGGQDPAYRVEDGYIVNTIIEPGNSQPLGRTPACQDTSAPSTLEVTTSRTLEDPDVMKLRNCRAIATLSNEEWSDDLTLCDRWANTEGRD